MTTTSKGSDPGRAIRLEAQPAGEDVDAAGEGSTSSGTRNHAPPTGADRVTHSRRREVGVSTFAGRRLASRSIFPAEPAPPRAAAGVVFEIVFIVSSTLTAALVTREIMGRWGPALVEAVVFGAFLFIRRVAVHRRRRAPS